MCLHTNGLENRQPPPAKISTTVRSQAKNHRQKAISVQISQKPTSNKAFPN